MRSTVSQCVKPGYKNGALNSYILRSQKKQTTEIQKITELVFTVRLILDFYWISRVAIHSGLLILDFGWGIDLEISHLLIVGDGGGGGFV
jgi:hypothetical protein